MYNNERARLPTFEISSSAERPSGACDDSGIERRFCVQPRPDLVEFSVPLLIDAVQVFRPIEPHEQDSGRGIRQHAVLARRLWQLEVGFGHIDGGPTVCNKMRKSQCNI